MVTLPSSPKHFNSPNLIQGVAQLCRPTLSVLAAVAGCLTIFALQPDASAWIYLQTATVLICMTAGAFAINDFDDIEKDRVNHPERPLPSGALLPHQAWWIAVMLFCGALGAAVPLGLACWILVAISTLLLWNYAAILNISGILGNGVVAMIVATLIFLASLVAERPLAMLYPSAFLFFYILAKEIVWDIHDAEGDRQRDVHTIANIWGPTPAFSIAWGLIVLLLTSIPIAIIQLTMAHPVLFGLCAPMMLVSFALALFRYQKIQTSLTYKNLIVLGRLGMILGLVGLLGAAPSL